MSIRDAYTSAEDPSSNRYEGEQHVVQVPPREGQIVELASTPSNSVAEFIDEQSSMPGTEKFSHKSSAPLKQSDSSKTPVQSQNCRTFCNKLQSHQGNNQINSCQFNRRNAGCTTNAQRAQALNMFGSVPNLSLFSNQPINFNPWRESSSDSPSGFFINLPQNSGNIFADRGDDTQTQPLGQQKRVPSVPSDSMNPLQSKQEQNRMASATIKDKPNTPLGLFSDTYAPPKPNTVNSLFSPSSKPFRWGKETSSTVTQTCSLSPFNSQNNDNGEIQMPAQQEIPIRNNIFNVVNTEKDNQRKAQGIRLSFGCHQNQDEKPNCNINWKHLMKTALNSTNVNNIFARSCEPCIQPPLCCELPNMNSMISSQCRPYGNGWVMPSSNCVSVPVHILNNMTAELQRLSQLEFTMKRQYNQMMQAMYCMQQQYQQQQVLMRQQMQQQMQQYMQQMTKQMQYKLQMQQNQMLCGQKKLSMMRQVQRPYKLMVKEHYCVSGIFVQSKEYVKAKYGIQVYKLNGYMDLIEALQPVLVNRMFQTCTERCNLKIISVQEHNGQYAALIQAEYCPVNSSNNRNYVIICKEKGIKLCGDTRGYAYWTVPSDSIDNSCEFVPSGFDCHLNLSKIKSNEVRVVMYPNYSHSLCQLQKYCNRMGGKLISLCDHDSTRMELKMLFKNEKQYFSDDRN